MKISRFLLVAILTAIVSGCGSDNGEGVAQSGSIIVMDPASTSAAVDVTVPAGTIQQPFTITVLNSSGNPLKGVRVDIFQDVGSLLDAKLNLQTGFPYQATTDDLGTIRVYVFHSAGGGLAYTGSLQAFSGAAYNNAVITVTCTDTDDTTAPNC